MNTPDPPQNTIYMFETNDDELRKLIHALKRNKAPGIDGITIKVPGVVTFGLEVTSVSVASKQMHALDCGDAAF